MKTVNYSIGQLKTFTQTAFMGFGFSETSAETITDVLLLADLYGITSHGVQRLVRYHKAIEKGSIDVFAEPEIVFETPVSAVIDGHKGMGQVIGKFAMNLAIEKAKKCGMAFVTVRNSNHFGIAGYYSKMACDEGLLGISTTNSESIMVHTNSRQALLGSNPIAVSMPAEPYPFWFDAATTVIPKGKLEVYNKADKPLNEGWTIDETGNTCTDAAKAIKCIDQKLGGGILPVGSFSEETGSHKGYGYGMICEIFSSIFSMGATSNHHVRQPGVGAGTCHGFMVIDPKIFGNADEIKEHLSVFLNELRQAKRREANIPIYTHGEKEFYKAEEVKKNGINVDVTTISEMINICKYLNIDSVKYLGDVDVSSAKESVYK